MNSSKMKGYIALPSHFLNVNLVDVWLEKE
jgi:hypothetical protein